MTPEVQKALTPHQFTIAARVLAEEAARRRHVVVSLSGAHAYGFPSPDSDVDIKAAHLDPTERLLGFGRRPTTAERLDVVEGVEVDYSSNEIGEVLRGVLKGNGNFIERFLSGYAFSAADGFADLQALVRGALCKRVYRHYRGFAASQLHEWEGSGRASVKKLLYVIRTALTGAHLLRAGEVVTDVTRLLRPYGFDDALALVEWKRKGERSELSPELSSSWRERLPRVFAALDDAHAKSALPEEPPNVDALETWVVERRLEMLRGR